MKLLPSVTSVLKLTVTLLVLLFVIRMFAPESIKALFRV